MTITKQQQQLEKLDKKNEKDEILHIKGSNCIDLSISDSLAIDTSLKPPTAPSTTSNHHKTQISDDLSGVKNINQAPFKNRCLICFKLVKNLKGTKVSQYYDLSTCTNKLLDKNIKNCNIDDDNNTLTFKNYFNQVNFIPKLNLNGDLENSIRNEFAIKNFKNDENLVNGLKIKSGNLKLKNDVQKQTFDRTNTIQDKLLKTFNDWNLNCFFKDKINNSLCINNKSKTKLEILLNENSDYMKKICSNCFRQFCLIDYHMNNAFKQCNLLTLKIAKSNKLIKSNENRLKKRTLFDNRILKRKKLNESNDNINRTKIRRLENDEEVQIDYSFTSEKSIKNGQLISNFVSHTQKKKYFKGKNNDLLISCKNISNSNENLLNNNASSRELYEKNNNRLFDEIGMDNKQKDSLSSSNLSSLSSSPISTSSLSSLSAPTNNFTSSNNSLVINGVSSSINVLQQNQKTKAKENGLLIELSEFQNKKINPIVETIVKSEPNLNNAESEVFQTHFERDKQQETLFQQNEAASRRKRKSINPSRLLKIESISTCDNNNNNNKNNNSNNSGSSDNNKELEDSPKQLANKNKSILQTKGCLKAELNNISIDKFISNPNQSCQELISAQESPKKQLNNKLSATPNHPSPISSLNAKSSSSHNHNQAINKNLPNLKQKNFKTDNTNENQAKIDNKQKQFQLQNVNKVKLSEKLKFSNNKENDRNENQFASLLRINENNQDETNLNESEENKNDMKERINEGNDYNHNTNDDCQEDENEDDNYEDNYEIDNDENEMIDDDLNDDNVPNNHNSNLSLNKNYNEEENLEDEDDDENESNEQMNDEENENDFSNNYEYENEEGAGGPLGSIRSSKQNNSKTSNSIATSVLKSRKNQSYQFNTENLKIQNSNNSKNYQDYKHNLSDFSRNSSKPNSSKNLFFNKQIGKKLNLKEVKIETNNIDRNINIGQNSKLTSFSPGKHFYASGSNNNNSNNNNNYDENSNQSNGKNQLYLSPPINISQAMSPNNMMQLGCGNNNSMNTKHSCDVCKKTFKTQNILRQHMRIHTGDKPFVCDICLKAFSQMASLKYHLATHSDDRPYRCDNCSKTFKLKPPFKKHIKECQPRSNQGRSHQSHQQPSSSSPSNNSSSSFFYNNSNQLNNNGLDMENNDEEE